MFLTIVTFILVLSLLVLVHEFGHFWVARKFGLKPKEFGFGFPPRAIGYYKNSAGEWKTIKGNKDPEDAADTIYSINWLPLGGFVNLEEDEEAGDDPNHFSNKPIWQRMAILLAGVTMNIFLAMALLSIGFMVGLPQSVGDLGSGAKVSNHRVQILEVMKDSPAEQAGLKAGDIITQINDQVMETTKDIQTIVNNSVNQSVKYTLKRGNEVIEKNIVPIIMKETNKGGVGISIGETGTVRYPFFLAIWEGVKNTLIITWLIMVAFYHLLKDLIMGNGVNVEIGGPVRIAEITGDAVRMGFSYLINFTALLSINLAIINAFPFPALDGGRIIFLIIEKIKGKPVSKKTEALIHTIGFALLMVLIVLVTYKDIARFWQ